MGGWVQSGEVAGLESPREGGQRVMRMRPDNSAAKPSSTCDGRVGGCAYIPKLSGCPEYPVHRGERGNTGR